MSTHLARKMGRHIARDITSNIGSVIGPDISIHVRYPLERYMHSRA